MFGIAGKRFPTPFSGGAGTLDSPVRNVLWGGPSLIAGGLLLWLISPGFSDAMLIAELIALAILLVCGLGAALSHEKKANAPSGER